MLFIYPQLLGGEVYHYYAKVICKMPKTVVHYIGIRITGIGVK